MYKHIISVGHSEVEVNAWTPEDATRYGVHNWSLKPIQNQNDVARHHSLANGLRATLSSIGARTVFAPNVAMMSGAVVPSVELMANEIRLNGACLYRDQNKHADGTILAQDETFVASTAGCAIVIASDKRNKTMTIAHAGRDSLIERKAVVGRPTRRHISIVYALIDALKELGARTGDINMCMLYSIPSESFEHRLDHPEHGHYNRALGKLIDTLWPGCTNRKGNSIFLDMESLFIAQALEVGVRHTWAMNSLADFPALAHTRDGKDPSRRNLFVVKRNS